MKMPKHSSLPEQVSPQRAGQQARLSPTVAQPKLNPHRLKTKSPVAPPVYRPQPVPKVLQAKKDVARMSLKPAATPACCPRPGLLQPKISTAQKITVRP